MKIDINYIARVEGEGSVKLEIKDGRLNDLKLNIWEPPRFFEGILCGRRFDEVPDIVARICGICPVSHMVTAIKAIEKALAITPSPEAVKLREIMTLSQMVSSHLVHLYMLVLPDYHRAGSTVELLPKFQKEVKRFLTMKEALNSVTAAFGGRAQHPVSMVVSGFTKTPDRDTVGRLMAGLEKIKNDALETLKMVAELPFPEHKNNSAYVALKSTEGYAINDGVIVSNSGIVAMEDDYLRFFHEEEVPYSNAKRTTIKGRGALMTGALARLNLKSETLHEDAKKAMAMAGVFPSDNPFHNNIAQAIEVVHGISECIALLDSLTGERPWSEIKLREGEGSALTEAPRGLLYHHYELNRMGVVEKANIVTPTAHNFLGLEENLRALVERYITEPEGELTLKCEMLVRAYDPCFSCSVH